MWGIAHRVMACTVAALGLGGCALSYDDSAGNRHIFGLADVTVVPPHNETLAGNVVAVTTIGALLSRNAQGNTLAFGYASETTAAIKDDAMVRGNPIEAIHDISNAER